MALNPLHWATQPRSRYAFAVVAGMATKGDPQFVAILKDLIAAGITDGTKLLKAWNGNEWVTA